MWGIGNSRRGCWQCTAAVNVARVVEDKPAEITLRNLMASERLKIVDLKGGVPATIELLQALRRNEIVAMQGDRVYQRHTFDVPFFSQPTSFPLGPFLLSQVSGAPVLPVFVIRRGWLRYHALMGDLIPRSSVTGHMPVTTMPPCTRLCARLSGFWKKR